MFSFATLCFFVQILSAAFFVQTVSGDTTGRQGAGRQGDTTGRDTTEKKFGRRLRTGTRSGTGTYAVTKRLS